MSACLFAEKAFGDDGLLKQPKELSINKVGHGLFHCYRVYDLNGFSHTFLVASLFVEFLYCFFYFLSFMCVPLFCSALHEIDPVFKKFSHSDKISGLLLSLGYKRPVIIQSMYIFKVP